MPPPWPYGPADPDPTPWAYLVETRALTQQLPGSPAETHYLSVRGELGWELVAVLQVILLGPHQSGLAYYWKRKGDATHAD